MESLCPGTKTVPKTCTLGFSDGVSVREDVILQVERERQVRVYLHVCFWREEVEFWCLDCDSFMDYRGEIMERCEDGLLVVLVTC
jgi:hypothetical protein